MCHVPYWRDGTHQSLTGDWHIKGIQYCPEPFENSTQKKERREERPAFIYEEEMEEKDKKEAYQEDSGDEGSVLDISLTTGYKDDMWVSGY